MIFNFFSKDDILEKQARQQAQLSGRRRESLRLAGRRRESFGLAAHRRVRGHNVEERAAETN